MQGGGDPLSRSRTERFATNRRGVSQTLAAVVVIAIGVVLVGVTLGAFTDIADRPDEPVTAATDVQLGPGGVAVEVQAVSNIDAILVRKNGELIRRIASPTAGIRTILDDVEPGDSVVVVGRVDGQQSVLDRITVHQDYDGSASDVSDPGSSDDGSDAPGSSSGDGSSGLSAPGGTSAGGVNGGSSGSDDGGGTNDGEDSGSDPSFAHEWSVSTSASLTAVGGTIEPVAGTESGTVVGFDGNGTEQWRTNLSSSPITDLATNESTAYAGTGAGTLARISDAGSVDWTVDFENRSGASDDVRVGNIETDTNGSVYVTLQNYNETAGFVVAKLSPDGTTQWTDAGDGSELVDSAVDDDGRVYVATTGEDGANLSRVDSNGTRSWSRELDRTPTAITADTSGTTVALSANGSASSTVERFDFDGSHVWQYDTGTTTNVTAVSSAVSRTYIGFDGGQSNLRVVNTSGGAVVSTTVTGDSGNPVSVTSLVADADGVTVGSENLGRFSTP